MNGCCHSRSRSPESFSPHKKEATGQPSAVSRSAHKPCMPVESETESRSTFERSHKRERARSFQAGCVARTQGATEWIRFRDAILSGVSHAEPPPGPDVPPSASPLLPSGSDPVDSIPGMSFHREATPNRRFGQRHALEELRRLPGIGHVDSGVTVHSRRTQRCDAALLVVAIGGGRPFRHHLARRRQPVTRAALQLLPGRNETFSATVEPAKVVASAAVGSGFFQI